MSAKKLVVLTCRAVDALLELLQITGAAEGRLHFSGIVELAVVNLVLAALHLEVDHGLEAVSPQDLGGQIGGARLRGLSGALDAALEDHDDLEALAHDVRGAQRVERAAYVNFVHHRHRPDEEDVVLVAVGAHHQLVLVHGQQLALLGLPRADQLRADACADDVRLAHVADAEHEAQLAVALADDGAAAEQQRLRPLLGPRHLGEHDAHHERLDHHARDALQAHDEDRLGTLLRRRSANNKTNHGFSKLNFRILVTEKKLRL
jgi:hypothetical protein